MFNVCAVVLDVWGDELNKEQGEDPKQHDEQDDHLGWHYLSNAILVEYGLACFLRHCLYNTAN